MKANHTVILLSILVFGLNGHKTGKSAYGRELFIEPGDRSISDSSVNNHPVRVDSFFLDILPPSSGVQFYKEGLVFLSSSKNEQKMISGHVSFGSPIAYYAVDQDTMLGERVVFHPSAPFSYPCEAITFSKDFSQMYFTKKTGKDDNEKIFAAEFSEKENIWVSDNNPLSFCAGNSVYSHPALSDDGNTILFVSNRSGSEGGMDLFKTRLEAGKWTEPVSLGSTINSKGNELFPFLDSENNLYFSSDGMKGYGGLDLFVCKYNGGEWGKPVNLTSLINSRDDEVAFTLNKNDGSTALFTRKQESDKTRMQLFRVTLNSTALFADANLSSLLYNFALLETDFPQALEKEPGKTEEAKPDKTEAIAETYLASPKNASTQAPANTVEVLPSQPSSKKEEKLETIQTPKSVEAPIPTAETTKANFEENKDVLIYRVQFAANTTAKGSYSVTIGGQSYKTFEYLYKGAYRSTVGELKTLAEAKSFQTKCRASGYPQAFVVAFLNNERSLDPALFK